MRSGSFVPTSLFYNRLRKTSYIRIAAATLALRLCTCPFIGIVIISSTCFLMLLEIPFPSFPIMRATFPLVFHLWQGVPFISVPKVQKPSSFSLSKVWLRLVTRAMGDVLDGTRCCFCNYGCHTNSSMLGNNDA